MKAKALRLYGKEDLRLDEYELPEIKDDEILARVVSDSICMSSYKAAMQGEDHKRVPENIKEHPVIIGHEFCGDLVKVGAKWAHEFKEGEKFSIQPALNYKGSLAAPGYSYEYIGGDATYIIIPNEVMEMGCLLHFDSDNFFGGSLTEPLSCVAGTFHAMHRKNGNSSRRTASVTWMWKKVSGRNCISFRYRNLRWHFTVWIRKARTGEF